MQNRNMLSTNTGGWAMGVHDELGTRSNISQCANKAFVSFTKSLRERDRTSSGLFQNSVALERKLPLNNRSTRQLKETLSKE